MDAYYRSNPNIIVVGDADAISTKRPLKYREHEEQEVQKGTKQGVLDPSKTEAYDLEHIESKE